MDTEKNEPAIIAKKSPLAHIGIALLATTTLILGACVTVEKPYQNREIIPSGAIDTFPDDGTNKISSEDWWGGIDCRTLELSIPDICVCAEQ